MPSMAPLSLISCLRRSAGPLLVLALLLGPGSGQAQSAGSSPNGGSSVSPEGTVQAWLLKAHDASRQRAFTGTFVVSSGAAMSSARIWHVCDGAQQMERIESLSGPPRATFRRDDQVMTFFPESRTAVSERRETLGLFPGLLRTSGSDIDHYYQLKVLGPDRAVGLDAEVAQLVPKDKLRYGYRVWTEKKTGLVLRLQTLDALGQVLEQSAFSELQLDAPVSMAKLSTMMAATEGYRVVHPEMQKVDARAKGWTLGREVAGFKSTGCFQRNGTAGGTAAAASGTPSSAETLQWIFSDGLAHVSLFVVPFDARRHTREGPADLGGATQSVSRRIGDWWLTVVGEVPMATLTSFAQALERIR